ncbi:LysR family transcriptional regulator [Undibacterium seohonense]|uniref:LysR family transcriptional regulator n=1 Tax=Undibacterium seohonense TaxID=1344950 RepID=A0ABR6X338_9BURK|nr:LysR family transcriptional regulator [Undibacterium seohonense]MBC3806965.1 LysR family transcriptional regulator [Undibacterium seohonense]
MRDPIADRFVRTHLKTKHLVLLVELGRHGSILRAAEAAHMTQPAASKLLADLEYALGVPLFDRLPRGIVPTWYGEIMIRRAGSALTEMNTAHQEVMEVFSGLRGQVSIGSVMTPSTSLIPQAVRLFKQTHSRVNVSISVDTSSNLLQQLRGGELDLMIGRLISVGEMNDELKFEVLQDEPHRLIVRAEHPLVKKDNLSFEDLSKTAWILPPTGSVLRDRLTALFLSQGVDMPVEAIDTHAIPVITSLLLGGDFVVALPPESVQYYLSSGLLVELDFNFGLRMDAYGIITRKQHRLSPSAQAMLDLVREVGGHVNKVR